MCFESVPAEVLNIIASNVDRPSLKALRLVSKRLGSCVTPLLFGDLEVWLQTTSLSRLVSIANDDALRQHARNLTITNDFTVNYILAPSTFIKQVDYEVFPSLVRGFVATTFVTPEAARTVTLEIFIEAGFDQEMEDLGWPEALNDAGWSPARLFEAWKLQRDVANEHARFMSSDEDVKCLVTALTRLSNLTSVRFTGGEGIGGTEKLLRDVESDYSSHGDIYRADGRQLTAFLLASASALETTNPSSNARVTSLRIDGSFWAEVLDKYSHSKTYTGTNRWGDHPNFGTIRPETLMSALPFLAAITTLEVPLHSRRGKAYNEDRQDIEERVATLLAALPLLEDLTLHNENYALSILHEPLRAMASTFLRTLRLQYCVIHLTDILIFLSNQAATLSCIHLGNIALTGGHFIDFFTFIRDTFSIKECVMNGWFVEFVEESLYFFADVLDDEVDFKEDVKRRDRAREGIAAFVTREREAFPVELLDVDSSTRTDYWGGKRGGVIEFIGSSRWLDEIEAKWNFS